MKRYADPVADAEVQRLRAKIAAALRLHRPIEDYAYPVPVSYPVPVCVSCGQYWPCRTHEELGDQPE